MDTPQNNHGFDGKERLDGRDLQAMFSCATRLIEHNVQSINVLNYFPVPDGDTGTNMYLTLKDMMAAVEKSPSDSAGEVAAAMARASLYGSRGNSGVILSQFFKGLAVALAGKADFGAAELADALRLAREYAYKAVPTPVEGTVLTIIDRVARAASEAVRSGGNMQTVLDAVCRAAREAVAITPSLLPAQRRAGVVDAGGHGMSVILEGLRMWAGGDGFQPREVPVPEPVPLKPGEEVFEAAPEHERYGYCTNLLIRGERLDVDEVRERMAEMGRSPAVVGDETMVKVHVHTEDPGSILSYAVSLGRIGQIKIDDMDEQHQQFQEARRQAGAPQPDEAEVSPVSVVAVAWGRGLERVFEELGAATIIRAGDTMNPSVQEIVSAIDAVPSRDVIFLPNNRNIIPAAQQALGLSQKSVSIVPTTTIPQGIAAMLDYNPELSLDDNASAMQKAIASVKTGEVCEAVRAAEIAGISVQRGQVIALMERNLVASGDSANDVLISMLQQADISEGQLVTLYWGEPVTRQEAEEAAGRITEAFPDAEVEVVEGGQPHYHYIVSIE